MTTKDGSPDVSARVADARVVVGEAIDHVLASVKRGVVIVPPQHKRLARFGFGLSLPFIAAGVALRDPLLGPAARPVLVLQALVTLGSGLVFFLLLDSLGDFTAEGGIEVHVSSGAGGVAAVFGWSSLTEWIVIAVSREQRDHNGMRTAELLGVPPDDIVGAPRVRIGTRWMWLKVKRRLQGAVVTVVIVASLVPLTLVVTIPLGWINEEIVDWAMNVVVSAVVFDCVAVIALGKTSWAWRAPPDRDPPPLRVLHAAATRAVGLRPLRLWAALLRRTMAMVVRPARLLERCPWEGAGLAVARVLVSPPMVYAVMRPFLPVAATTVLATRAAETFTAPMAVVDHPPPTTS